MVKGFLLISFLLLSVFMSSELRNVTYTTVYVDKSGKGNYTTIQEAIDDIPSNNNRWVQIQVQAGQYIEQVAIPEDKPFIYIQGRGKGITRVEWNLTQIGDMNVTFLSRADNILVKDITLVNTYNYPPGPSTNNNNVRIQAVAAKVSGDKTSFYGVEFLGVQDTLYDDKGRHYFEGCTIEGSVDFIFGAGQSFYHNCTISVIATATNVSLAYITAQGRTNESDPNGFVFKDCTIVGDGSSLLGRAWKNYSRVFFINTTMPNIIAPRGWWEWNVVNVSQLTYGEYNCTGLGANTSGRIKWETTLTPTMIDFFGNLTYVDLDGWIANQP